jgi:hypothetical protein
VAAGVATVACGAIALYAAACSSNGEGSPPSADGSSGSAADAADAEAGASADASSPFDSSVADAPADGSSPFDSNVADSGDTDARLDGDASAVAIVGLAIITATGAPLQGAPGDAVPLTVALRMSDGTTTPVAPDQVTWLAPATITAEDPNAPGGDILPEAGAQPTGFFVHNPYRQDNPGVVYVTDPGAVSNPTIRVTASVMDAAVSAELSVLPAPVGDPARGAALFAHGPDCGICHGATGGGSPPALLPDGGLLLFDGGPAYSISGQLYPYPAPGLDDAPDSGNLATDPAWNAALLGLAAQADVDNSGVALRSPMPDWFSGTSLDGGALSAQDFADIYAWLKTQTD